MCYSHWYGLRLDAPTTEGCDDTFGLAVKSAAGIVSLIRHTHSLQLGSDYLANRRFSLANFNPECDLRYYVEEKL